MCTTVKIIHTEESLPCAFFVSFHVTCEINLEMS